MDISVERIEDLKRIVHSHLDQFHINERIKSTLEQRRETLETATEEGINSMLNEEGVIEEILKGLKFEEVLEKSITEPKVGRYELSNQKKQTRKNETDLIPVDPKKRYIYLQVTKGKAFLEHLQDPEVTPGNSSSVFTLNIYFRGQRFKSRDVFCSCEPDFQEGFLLNLQGSTNERMADATSLLTNTDDINIVLIKNDSNLERYLVSSYQLDWRKLLQIQQGVIHTAIELNGIGAENKIPAGVLDVKMEILPKLDEVLASDVVSHQRSIEKSRISERERLFLVYTKQWWREFLNIRESHNSRLVKIFAQDENGVHHPVCHFVQPINTLRLIDSSRHAARFVSLFDYEKTSSLGSTSTEMWTSMHSFLSRGKGDVESHACLLCSLLIGFGLNAYVCIGTKCKGVSHAWVVTIEDDCRALFWESLTAERFQHTSVDPTAPPLEIQPQPDYTYKTIGCIFNHQSFFANTQPTDHVDMAVFDLRNEALWKSMSIDAIRSVCGEPYKAPSKRSIPLVPSKSNESRLSDDCEKQLKSMVVHHRQDMGLSTQWDDQLAYILSPALSSYELQHCLGVSVGNNEFQQAVKHHVPNGHTFKAFPIQLTHTDARKAFAYCLRSAVCEEIIRCRGDAVRHAIRVKVVSYPEQLCAMWIMFAVQYKSVL